MLRQNEPNMEGALFSLLRTEKASQANFGRLALDVLEEKSAIAAKYPDWRDVIYWTNRPRRLPANF